MNVNQSTVKMISLVFLVALVAYLVHLPVSWMQHQSPKTEFQKDTLGWSQVNVTNHELRIFSKQVFHLLSSINGYSMNYQKKTTSFSKVDEAPLPLLNIRYGDIEKNTTNKLLRQLYDNYIIHTNQNEISTDLKTAEEHAFLDAVVSSTIMQVTANFLINKNVVKDRSHFRSILHQIWFTKYPRGGKTIGSSGFEHVFLAEIRRRNISGLHNWIYFGERERLGHINYLGYLSKLEFDNHTYQKGGILKFSFIMDEIHKPVSSMFFGTPPEFEMALYTVCFLVKGNSACTIELNKRVTIRTFRIKYNNTVLIGSAFPII